jgi:protein phosphatase
MNHDLLPGRALLVDVAAATDPGRKRTQNQDRFLVADLSGRDPDRALLEGGDERPGLQGPTRYTVGPFGSLFLVADGMGGAAGGATASAMASRVIHGLMTTQWVEERTRIPAVFARHLRSALEQANHLIRARAHREGELRGMGTTATAVGVLDAHLILAQVGDSRAYLIRGGVATQLTRDQSVVQMLQESGQLDEASARIDQRSNLILQALGTAAEVDVDLTHQPLRRNDTLLLCSDGLSGQMETHEIADAVGDGRALESSGRALVELANARGGPDNITVILAHFDGDALAPPVRDEPVSRKPLDVEDP